MAKKRAKNSKNPKKPRKPRKPKVADNASLYNQSTDKAYAHASVQVPSNTYVLFGNDRGAFLSVSLIEEHLVVEYRVRDRIVATVDLAPNLSNVTITDSGNRPCLDLGYDAKTNQCTLIRRDERGLVSKTTL